LPTDPIRRTLGIIPARGGSKGVVHKNIRLVGGKPLIAYSIQAAKESRLVTDYVVSTDDDEIAALADQLGARVEMRPVELAADDTPMLPVIQQVIGKLRESDDPFEYAVLLQPTAPLRTGADVDTALEMLFTTGADSVVSVYQVIDAHPARMYRIRDNLLVPYAPEPSNRLRQRLPPVYLRNGAIYAFRCGLIDEQGTLIGANTRPYIMPRERSINIDEEFDLYIADLLLQPKRTKAE
jgi:CMP-N,N'-diacetyllegionaminic acid synthase